MIRNIKNAFQKQPATIIFTLILIAILATNAVFFSTMSYGTENISEAILVAYAHNEDTRNTAILGWDTLNYRLALWESSSYKHRPLKMEIDADGTMVYSREQMPLYDGFHFFLPFALSTVNDYDGNTNTVETSYKIDLIKEIDFCKEEGNQYYNGELCTNSGIWNTLMDMKKRPEEACISTYNSGMRYTDDNHIASGSYSKWPKTEIIETFWGYQITVTPYIDRVWLDDSIVLYRSNGDMIYAVTDSDEQLEPSNPRAQAIFAEANQLDIDWHGAPVSTFYVLSSGDVVSTNCSAK